MTFGSYKQYDSRWSKKNYNGSSNYSQAGCGPTACANILYAIDSSITPLTTGKFMQDNGYAIRNNGTAWNGIPACLKYFGAKEVQNVDVSTSMTKVWELMEKGFVGVFLFRAGTRGNITWTTSGHYLAVTGYKVEGGKHYLRMMDSGGRDHDGWYCYETQMKRLIPRVWLCTVSPKTGSKYTGTLTLQTAKIGQATQDERGKTTGGKAGDQTGKEVAISNWSYNKTAGKWNHWTHLYRAKDKEDRIKIGNDMIWCCENNNIGYDAAKPARYTFRDLASKVGWDARKVTSKCETTCGQTVGVCLEYIGITFPRYVSNLTVINTLNKSGKVTLIQGSDYLAKSDKLMKGDVLVSKNHHTGIITQGTAMAKGDKSTEVKNMQKFLNWYGFKLAEDGDFGAKTEEAVISFQTEEKLLVDGIFGNASLKKAKEVTR